MAIRLSCPQCKCNAIFNLNDEFAGKVARCTKCGQHFRVPGAPNPASPPLAQKPLQSAGKPVPPTLPPQVGPSQRPPGAPPSLPAGTSGAIQDRSKHGLPPSPPPPPTPPPPGPAVVPPPPIYSNPPTFGPPPVRAKTGSSTPLILLGVAVSAFLVISVTVSLAWYFSSPPDQPQRAEKYSDTTQGEDEKIKVQDKKIEPKEKTETKDNGTPKNENKEHISIPGPNNSEAGRKNEIEPVQNPAKKQLPGKNQPVKPKQEPPLKKTEIKPIKPAPKQEPPLKKNDKKPIEPSPGDSNKTVINLPGTISRVRLGGGGQLIILYIPDQKQLAIFDTKQAKIVKYLSVASGNMVFTAGQNTLVVAYPQQNILQRWDLKTFKREVTVNPPFTETIRDVCMGHASNGPLLIATQGTRTRGGRMLFLDLMTFQEMKLPVIGEGRNNRMPAGGYYLHASANGKLFGMRQGVGAEPHTVGFVKIEGKWFRPAGLWGFSGSVMAPSPDGRFVYAADGVYNADYKLVYPKKPQTRFAQPYIPASHGQFFLRLEPKGWDQLVGKIHFYVTGNFRPIAVLDDVEGVSNEQISYGKNRDSLTTTERIHFFPDAKLVVSIPSTNDRLLLHRFDPYEAMEKSGVDYLIVTSQPFGFAVKGEKYIYPMQIKAKKNGVKVKLESGPEGMKIVKNHVVWDVPANHAEEEVSVITTVSDSTGQELFHTFTLKVVSSAPEGVIPPKIAKIEIPKENPDSKNPAPKKEVDPPKEQNPLQIVSPKLAKKKTVIMLPTTMDDLAVGGGGRYLLLRLPKLRKIAMFDVNKAKIVHYFPVAGPDAGFTAGRTKLVMIFPGSRVLQLWDLQTRTKESTINFPFAHDATMALMGSDSEGPLLVGKGGYFILNHRHHNNSFLDLQTLKVMNIQLNGRPDDLLPDFSRVSADGTVWASWRPGTSPQGLRTFVFTGKNTVRSYYDHTSVGHMVPGPYGKYLYTGRGIYTAQTKPVGNNRKYVLPSVRGNFYFQVLPGSNNKGNLSLFLVGDNRPLLFLPEVINEMGASGRGGFNQWAREKFGNDKRINFIPPAKMIVTVPFTNDRLHIHRFDVEEALKKAGVEYLYVSSQPPSTATSGRDFVYGIQVKSKRGGVRYKLDIGPEGMRVNDQGVLQWRIPATLGGEFNVVLSISDRSGQEIFHTFKLTVE